MAKEHRLEHQLQAYSTIGQRRGRESEVLTRQYLLVCLRFDDLLHSCTVYLMYHGI